MRVIVEEVSTRHSPDSLVGRLRGVPGLMLLRTGIAFFFGVAFIVEVALILAFGVDQRLVEAAYIGTSSRFGDLRIPNRMLVAFGVATLLTLNQQGIVGESATPLDVTYLTNAAILMRYFESDAEIRRALSVVKRRMGAHQASIREMFIAAPGIRLGQQLTGYRGVLSGLPEARGNGEGMPWMRAMVDQLSADGSAGWHAAAQAVGDASIAYQIQDLVGKGLLLV